MIARNVQLEELETLTRIFVVDSAFSSKIAILLAASRYILAVAKSRCSCNLKAQSLGTLRFDPNSNIQPRVECLRIRLGLQYCCHCQDFWVWQ